MKAYPKIINPTLNIDDSWLATTNTGITLVVQLIEGYGSGHTRLHWNILFNKPCLQNSIYYGKHIFAPSFNTQ